jgi:hypothetical protein
MRRALLITGVFLLLLNTIYFLFLGPTLLDIPGGHHLYSLLNGLIETGGLPALSWERFFYNTSLSMLGWNCILAGLLSPLLFPRARVRPGLKTPAVLCVAGGILVLASFVRIPLYPIVEEAVKKPDLAVAFLGSVFINKNDPLLPYLGFALIGAALGHAFIQGLTRRRVTVAFGLFGLVWLAAGVVGYLALPDTMLERSVDEMWFTIIVMQVGAFTLLVLGAWLLGDRSPAERRDRPGVIKLCGRASLTIFILETPVRPLVAALWDRLAPGWSAAIPTVLIFASFMALLWIAVLAAWRRARFIGSLEWLIGRLYAAIGRVSAKEEALGIHGSPWFSKSTR